LKKILKKKFDDSSPLLQNDDKDSESESEAESSLLEEAIETIVHFKEEIYRRTHEIKLAHFDELPAWLQDNQFIKTGHRNANLTKRALVKSLFTVHNETLNIWTHLICFILLLFLMLYTYVKIINGSHWTNYVVFTIFFVERMLPDVVFRHFSFV